MRLTNNAVLKIIEDSVKNNRTLEETCNQIGVPYAVLREALDKKNAKEHAANKETLRKMRVIAMQLARDFEKFKKLVEK